MAVSDRIFKAAMAEKVSGINAVTLRSYRRRGLLEGLDFTADGTMARYSFIDLVIFKTAVELEKRAHMSPTSALELAIEMRRAIEVIVSQRDESPSPVEMISHPQLPPASRAPMRWRGWAVINSRGGNHFIWEATDNLSNWFSMSSAFGETTVFVVVDLAKIAQKTVTALTAHGEDWSRSQ